MSGALLVNAEDKNYLVWLKELRSRRHRGKSEKMANERGDQARVINKHQRKWEEAFTPVLSNFLTSTSRTILRDKIGQAATYRELDFVQVNHRRFRFIEIKFRDYMPENPSSIIKRAQKQVWKSSLVAEQTYSLLAPAVFFLYV